MFTLIGIGVGAAFVLSAVAMLTPGVFPNTMQHEGKVAIYFESAAMVVVLVLLGQVLELRARSRTGSAIKASLNLALPTGGFDPKEFLRLAASLEQNSEHPLAAAIVQGAKERGIVFEAVKDFRSVTGGGVLGTVSDRAVMIGKPEFPRIEKITGLEPLETSARKLQEEGKTAMFVTIDGKPTGILAVADPIKSTTLEAVRELHALGLKLVMLTGDNRRTADAVAKQLGLDAVVAEIEPAGKVDHIKKLRAEGVNTWRWLGTASTTHRPSAKLR